MEIVLNDMIAKCEVTDEVKTRVFNKIVYFLSEHEVFNGESIMQTDSVHIHAPELLAAIADEIIKFEVEISE